MTERARQIFISGTWREANAAPYRDVAFHAGAAIAGAGYSLACGPGTGIARHAIDGFRSVTARSGLVRFFLPRAECMLAAGETAGDGADEVVQTEFDYPMRNTYQISLSSGVLAITGGDGTLEELLPALIDYRLPVGVLKDSGLAATGIAALAALFPEWSNNLVIDTSPQRLLDHVLGRI